LFLKTHPSGFSVELVIGGTTDEVDEEASEGVEEDVVGVAPEIIKIRIHIMAVNDSNIIQDHSTCWESDFKQDSNFKEMKEDE